MAVTGTQSALIDRASVQASRVDGLALLRCRLGALAIWTKSLTPSRLNAWATLPAAKLAPLVSVPWLAATRSVAAPSPAHQPTRPDGGATAAGTVRSSSCSTDGRSV